MSQNRVVSIVAFTVVLAAVVLPLCASSAAKADPADIANLQINTRLVGGSTHLVVQFDLRNHISLFGSDTERYHIYLHGNPSDIDLTTQTVDVPAYGTYHVSYDWDATAAIPGQYRQYQYVYVELWDNDNIFGVWSVYQMSDCGYITIDTAAPTITSSVSRAPDSNGWYNHPVTVSFASTDYGQSGLVYPQNVGVWGTAHTSQTVSSDGDAIAVAEHATDVAGNTAWKTVVIHYDATRPAIAVSTSPSPNAAGWFNAAPVTITFTATDYGSGIETSSPGSVTMDSSVADGSHMYTSSATDYAGNTNSVTYTAKLDRAKPSSSIALSGTAGSNGWYTSSVDMTLTASDATSGVKRIEYSTNGGATWTPYSSKVTLSTQGTTTVWYRAVDNADNVEDYHTQTIKIDTSNPTIGYTLTPPPNAAGWNKNDVLVHFTATDSASEVASVSPDQTVTAEGSNQHVAGTAMDNAGRSSSTTAYVSLDKTAPTTSCSLAGTAGTNGWNTSSVVMTLSATDSLSGIKRTEYSTNGGTTWNAYSGKVTFSNEGNTTVQYRSVDNADNVEAAQTVSFKIDTSNPVITGSLTPSPNAAGWNKNDVLVHFTASDSVSDIASVTPDQTVTTEGNNQSVTGTALDNAGNSASTTMHVSLDKTAPATTDSLTGTMGTNNWYTSNVQVTLTPVDSISGVKQTEYSTDDGTTWNTYIAPFTISAEGPTTVQYYTTDNADNAETAKQVSFKVDKTAPTTGCSLSGTTGSDSWYTSDVVMTLTPADAMSGIKLTEYSTDNGETWTTYKDSVTFGKEGATTVQYRSVDMAGNVESSGSVSFKIDKTAPYTDSSLAGTMGTNSWYTSNVVVTLSPKDGVSDVGLTEYSTDGTTWNTYAAPFTISTEGTTTVQYHSTDKAGNVEKTRSVSFKVDKTTPVTAYSLAGTLGDNGWYTSNTVMTLTFADSVSGVNWTEYSVDGGTTWTTYSSPVTFSAPGITNVQYRSIDLAGNVEKAGSASFKIDKAAPATAYSLSGKEGGHGWYNSSEVAVTLTADDHATVASGSVIGGSGDVAGVKQTLYKVDGGEWQEYSGSVTVGDNVSHTVRYYSVDLAGNTEDEHTLQVNIDPFQPVSSAALAGTMGDNQWYVSDVAVTITASDVGASGVAVMEYSFDSTNWTTYTTPVTVAADGLTTVYYRSIDTAGNVEAAKQVSFKADRTKPVLSGSVTGPRSNLGWFDGDASLSVSSSDATSGISSVMYSLDGTQWNNYTGAVTVKNGGSHYVYYSATDNAGNRINGTSYVYFAPLSIQYFYSLISPTSTPTPTPTPTPAVTPTPVVYVPETGTQGSPTVEVTIMPATTPTATTEQTQPGNNWLLYLAGLAALGLGGAGAWLLFFKK